MERAHFNLNVIDGEKGVMFGMVFPWNAAFHVNDSEENIFPSRSDFDWVFSTQQHLSLQVYKFTQLLAINLKTLDVLEYVLGMEKMEMTLPELHSAKQPKVDWSHPGWENEPELNQENHFTLGMDFSKDQERHPCWQVCPAETHVDYLWKQPPHVMLGPVEDKWGVKIFPQKEGATLTTLNSEKAASELLTRQWGL